MDSAIKIKLDTLHFPNVEKPILHHIDLTVNQGDFLAITGSVASGKSSLLHCITGAIPKFHTGILEGTVRVMGEDIKEIPLPNMTKTMGYMMQDPQNQMIDVKVYEDIAFGIGNQECPKEEIKSRVEAALDFVGLKGFENRRTDSLSGGEAQRVVLGGVFAMEPKILLLDQPTAELDPKGRRELYAHLAKLNREKGITIVMVMDRVEEVMAVANRVVLMAEGTIVKEMTPREFRLENTAQKETETPKTYGETIIDVRGAAHTYKGGFLGCNPINLSVREGEFLSIVGLNGSGKTTLLKMLEGLLLPTQGQVFIFQEEMTKPSAKKLREKIGFLFQNPDYQIFADTVLKEVTFGLKLRKMPPEEMTKRGIKALEAMGLLAYQDLHPQMLSRGQRQLLALYSILIHEPDLIIADEPTSGLDEAQSHVIMQALKNFTNQGKTVLLVSHDLTLAKKYSHRMIAMYKHNIVGDFAMKDMAEHENTLVNIGLLQGVTHEKN